MTIAVGQKGKTMDNWTVEMIGDSLGNCRYICTYETSDNDKVEKLKKIFEALRNDSDSKEV